MKLRALSLLALSALCQLALAADPDCAMRPTPIDIARIAHHPEVKSYTVDANKLGVTALLKNGAGGVAVCGSRLAGVGSAMNDAGMDLNPINEGTNTVLHAGDCGRATPYLMLGLAAAKAVELQKPTLVTHFQARHVAVSFVLPASA